MSTELLEAPPQTRTLADLLRELGDIPPQRVRLRPNLGHATIDDLIKPENKRCELIDGTLVEKAMGLRESVLARFLAELFGPFIREKNLGILSGSDGPYEVLAGLVRLPDLAFVSWERLPGRRLPDTPVAVVVPDLVIEVLSLGNTSAEMARKRDDYFRAGVTEVWEINPRIRTARVYTDADTASDFGSGDRITTPVLPGFTLNLAELFAELDRHG